MIFEALVFVDRTRQHDDRRTSSTRRGRLDCRALLVLREEATREESEVQGHVRSGTECELHARSHERVSERKIWHEEH